MKYLYIILFFTLIYSSPILSQEDEDEEEYEEKKELTDTTKKKVTALEEIVITGTRTEKMIIDIPYSVFRVDKKEFVYGRDLNAKDILQDVPGLFIQTRYGSEVRISIRGFGTRSNTGVRGIRILQDGIPESEPDGETTMDAVDYTSLGGVEVVKGNQSSLYPNSPGGVVNFLSDLNFTKSYVRLVSMVGEYKLSQGGVRLGLVGDNSRFFLSQTYKNYVGYRPHGAEYSHLINANYVTYPNTRTSVAILGNYVRGLVRFPGGLTAEEYNTDPFQPYFQNVASDIRRETQKGRLAIKYKTSWGKLNENEFEVIGFGAVKDLQFTTNTLYNIKYKYVLGSTIRYTSRHPLFKRDNEFTAGADYNYVTGPLSAYTNLGGVKGDELQAQNTETQSNYGFFFENQVNITKGKLYFLVSGRYDKLIFTNNDELLGFRNSTRDFDRFTPKFALNYKLTPTVSAYTSFGFGFDSPSATELENYPYSSNNGLTTLNPDIKPQTSKNFEIGIKGNVFNRGSKFMKKALFEFTFFNTKVEDEIIPFIVSDRVYFRNAAQTNRIGFESGMKVEPIERMDVIVNYTYTNFKYDKYISRSYDAIGNPVDVDYSSNRVPAVPQHLVNFIVEGEPEIAKHLEALLIFDCDYATRMFVDDQNTESTSPYFFANLMAGINYTKDKFNVILSTGVKNLFDRRYVGFININANPEFPQNQRRYFEPGEPRNYYVTLNMSYKF